MDELQTARRAFADDLRKAKSLQSDALVDAFAAVPRERFLGSPPWKIWDPIVSPTFVAGKNPYVESDDPRALYRDVLVALDAERGINNGQPSLWAIIYDRLNAARGERIVHIGCGVGYYTAVLAELVGPSGSVVGLDVDPVLLARARQTLAGWANVEVKERNGALHNEGPADIIIVNAGITHPLDIWLDALKPGGRLAVPLTFEGLAPNAGFGAFFKITRCTDGFAAAFVCPTGIIHFAGARDAEANKRLMETWRDDLPRASKVASLRRDAHDKDPTCWLHGQDYCLSTKENGPVH
jgi:protein-L-isoaspartate(D-aspartate) O-methyltransferase